MSEPKELTQQEFMDKYGNETVTLDYYYKYWFYYTATLGDGRKLTVGTGGDSDSIYRFEAHNNESLTVSQIQPEIGNVYLDEKEIEWFSEQ